MAMLVQLENDKVVSVPDNKKETIKRIENIHGSKFKKIIGHK